MGALSRKNIVVCYLWWFFLGLFGAHRFYLRKWCTAVIWLFTFGVFTIGWFVDLFLIPGMVENYNYVVEGQKAEILRRSDVAPPDINRPTQSVQNVYINHRPAGGQTSAVQATETPVSRAQAAGVQASEGGSAGGYPSTAHAYPQNNASRSLDAGVGADYPAVRVVEYPHEYVPVPPGYEMRQISLPDGRPAS